MSIVIITDSTAGLPAEYCNDHNIKVVPLNVHIDNKTYREGIDISNRDYYSLLRSKPIFPQTSQPSVGDFIAVYKELSPADKALVITISSAISGTIQAATMAKEMLHLENRIEIVDSESTIIGQGFQVMKACEMAEDNKSMDEILVKLKNIRQNLKILFVVDDLEYLARGGRISHVSKHIGNILKLKPVLSIFGNGKIELYEKVRTKPKAIKKILKTFYGVSSSVEMLSVVHVDTPQEADALLKQVRDFYPGPVIITEPGPVIGSHVGPGSIGLAFY